MVLDPTHMKYIAGELNNLDSKIGECNQEYREERIQDILQKIKEVSYKNKILIQLLDENILYKVGRDQITQIDEPFEKTYAIDSGTLNPISYTNGTVFDICHAAMASTPIDREIERHRTLGTIIYVSDDEMTITPDLNWQSYDEEYGRSITLLIYSSMLSRRIPDTIHNIILKFTESEHMLWLQDKIEPKSMVILDGSIYPKQIMYWVVDSTSRMMIRHDRNTQKVLQNYIDIANHAFNNDIPLIGFVKNPIDSQIVRSTTMEDFDIWSDDTQLFKYILSSCKDEQIQKSGITYTGWFWQNNRIYGSNVEKASPLVGEGIRDIIYPEEDYDPVFFIAYLPRTHTLFKIESLYGFIKDEQKREKITQKILSEIATNESVPRALNYADQLAKISRKENRRLREIVTKSNQIYDYNARRWPDSEIEGY